MGCIASKKEPIETIFEALNVNEAGAAVNECKIEITDHDLALHQEGKTTIRWPLKSLRRYGFDADHFSFESGRRCHTGPGIYAFRCKKAEQLFHLVQRRTQSRSNGEWETTITTSHLSGSGPSRDSMFSEAASLKRSITESKFSSQNDGTTRLSSVGSTSGSVGPLSPLSITSLHSPSDSVPLIPPNSPNFPVGQTVYANDDIITAFIEDLEEKNNNKTSEEPVFSTSEHSYSNLAVLDVMQQENLSNLENGNSDLMEGEISSPIQDNKHSYMNIGPGQEGRLPLVTVRPPQKLFLLDAAVTEKFAPQYENFDAALSQELILPRKRLNYIVLDLESNGVSSTSKTASLQDIPKKSSAGYAAIDFKKTVALSHTVRPFFNLDSEGSRRTRHNSNPNCLLIRKRLSTSVSD